MKDTKQKNKTKRTALVTGASRGIGKAIAAALARDGWEVTGTSRNPKKLSAEDRVPGVRYLPLDFARRASVEALARKARGFDLLINNAGGSAIGPAEEAPLEKVRALFEANFFGAVRLTQAVLPGMRARRAGTVIFVGSMAGEAPRAFSAFYAASKAAIRLFAECTRMEVKEYGIRVAIIAPYFISTTIKQEDQVKRGSPYAAAVQRVKQVRDRILMSGAGPEVVAERLMDILGKRSPPAFTVVGRHARPQAFLIRHLPRRVVETLSARRFKL
jgi:short-subunit dehydrogenase